MLEGTQDVKVMVEFLFYRFFSQVVFRFSVSGL